MNVSLEPADSSLGILLELSRGLLPPLHRLLPANRAADRLHCFLSFVIQHRRLPRERRLLNDLLYRMRNSDELLDPLRVRVSDKEHVKQYIAETVGARYHVPTVAVLHTPEEVRTFAFPEACCIKPTHASGDVVLRTHNEPLDLPRIEAWFGLDYYRQTREINYKPLEKKVLVEPLVFERADNPDYKLFCWQGAPRLIQVDSGRHVKHTRDLFDLDWNPLDFCVSHPRCGVALARPECLDEMLSIAARLSAAFSFVRVDFYSDGNTCVVGEITNCPEGSMGRYFPRQAEWTASEILFGELT